jgi:exonuclease VII small subunit
MNERMPMFPKAEPPRANEDTSVIEQVVEKIEGEVDLDQAVKAQTSAPQVSKRMVELENSMWSLVRLLLLLPEETRAKIGANDAIEHARALLLHSAVMDHGLEVPEETKTSDSGGHFTTLFPRASR